MDGKIEGILLKEINYRIAEIIFLQSHNQANTINTYT